MKQPWPEIIGQVATAYLAGVSAAELGKRFGVSGDTILAQLRKIGVRLRSKAQAARMPRKGELIAARAKGRPAWNKGLNARADGRVEAYARKLVGREVGTVTRAKFTYPNEFWFEMMGP